MQNVSKVWITSEVAEMLNYDTAYLIRTANGLKEKGILNAQSFRMAGKRNYLFNEEAVRQLKIKFNMPEFYLMRRNDEEPYIHEVYYRELSVSPDEAFLVLHNDEEYTTFNRLMADETEEGQEALDEFLSQKAECGEHLECTDDDGWMYLYYAEELADKGALYHLSKKGLTPVTRTDLANMVHVYAYQDTRGRTIGFAIEEVVSKVGKLLFEASGAYYVYDSTGPDGKVKEAEVEEAYRAYYELPFGDALKTLTEAFDVTFAYETIGYWRDQLHLKTRSGQLVPTQEVVIDKSNQSACLANRDIMDIITDLQEN